MTGVCYNSLLGMCTLKNKNIIKNNYVGIVTARYAYIYHLSFRCRATTFPEFPDKSEKCHTISGIHADHPGFCLLPNYFCIFIVIYLRFQLQNQTIINASTKRVIHDVFHVNRPSPSSKQKVKTIIKLCNGGDNPFYI